jgi:hypothetical protein
VKETAVGPDRVGPWTVPGVHDRRTSSQHASDGGAEHAVVVDEVGVLRPRVGAKRVGELHRSVHVASAWRLVQERHEVCPALPASAGEEGERRGLDR